MFPCGGNEDEHASRRMFKRYVKRCNSASLSNVFCLTAEDVAKRESLRKLNLLKQEALLADICDWIIIFAESVGSFCELGAFSALPNAAAITSVAIDKKYRGESSYLIEGPVREISESKQPLSKVFYIDLNNPFSSKDFSQFVSSLRSIVTLSDRFTRTSNRKPINKDADNVDAGSLAHELLDLLQYVGPIRKEELIEVYSKVKGFDKRRIKIISRILSEDMGLFPDDRRAKLSINDVIEMLCVVGLIEERRNPVLGTEVVSSGIYLNSYFMFSDNYSKDFSDTHAKILLRKRSRGLEYGKEYSFKH